MSVVVVVVVVLLLMVVVEVQAPFGIQWCIATYGCVLYHKHTNITC
jgi:hypothetical protein